MHIINKSIFVIVIFFAVLHAQRQRNIIKVGCIDIQKIIDKIAADRLLSTVLLNKKNDSLRRAEELSKEINVINNILAKESSVLPEDRINAYKEELLLKQNELKTFLEQQKIIISQEEKNINVEILKSVYEYIRQTALKNGFSLILEKGTAVIYAEPEIDITEEVLAELEKAKTPLNAGAESISEE